MIYQGFDKTDHEEVGMQKKRTSYSQFSGLENLLQEAEKAQSFLTRTEYPQAIKSYEEVFLKLAKNEILQPQFLAKLSLEYMVSLLAESRVRQGFEVWSSRPQENIFGVGIQALDLGYAHIQDLINYDFVCAYFQAISHQKAVTKTKNINLYLSRITEYAAENHNMELLTQALSNWRLLLNMSFGHTIPHAQLKEYLKYYQKHSKYLHQDKLSNRYEYLSFAAWEAQDEFKALGHVLGLHKGDLEKGLADLDVFFTLQKMIP